MARSRMAMGMLSLAAVGALVLTSCSGGGGDRGGMITAVAVTA